MKAWFREVKSVLHKFAVHFTIFSLAIPLLFELKLGPENNIRVIWIGTLISLALAFLRSLEKTKITLKLGSGYVIKVVCGNLFESDANALCFSIADTLETDSKTITAGSVTYQVVDTFFHGDAANAKIAFQDAFKVHDKTETGLLTLPAIGFLETEDTKLFAVAAFKMNNEKMVQTTMPMFVAALENLWELVRVKVSNEPVAMPLIGTGFGRVNISDLAMLQLIILSYVSAHKKQPVTRELTIYIPEKVEKLMYMDELRSWFSFVIMDESYDKK